MTHATEELIAIAEHADRTMTPGEWLSREKRPYQNVTPYAMLERRTGSGVYNGLVFNYHGEALPNDVAGIAALRNNAAAFARRLAEQDATIAELQRRQRSDEDQLCRIAKSLGKDARHSEDGTIAGLVYELRERAEKAEAERDELLASYQKVVGEHNGLVLAGDSLLAKAGQYRIERDAALAKCRELEDTLQSLQTK